MLRDNLVGLIEPMANSAGVGPLALSIQKQASDDRSICLENPRPEGAESSLTENVISPFQAEPAQVLMPVAVVHSLVQLRTKKLETGTGTVGNGLSLNSEIALDRNITNPIRHIRVRVGI